MVKLLIDKIREDVLFIWDCRVPHNLTKYPTASPIYAQVKYEADYFTDVPPGTHNCEQIMFYGDKLLKFTILMTSMIDVTFTVSKGCRKEVIRRVHQSVIDCEALQQELLK